MKRHHVHLGFGAAALALAALAAVQAWQWREATRINAALAAGAGAGDAPYDEVRLAQALKLAGAGSTDAALAAYQQIVRGPRSDLARIAQYDIGNLHLRAALKDGSANVFKSVTLVELAKQHYRTLLRDDPHDWDARFNLERALALAPEAERPPAADAEPPPPKERAASTLPGTRSDLP